MTFVKVKGISKNVRFIKKNKMMMMFMIMMTMVNKFGQNFKVQKLRC